ncbi:CshA/CshB family fibrillar adhesin-related protein [Arthrobacter gengyunqii]|uniref:CshA/CshB family fibrillar adhesin-related protein n=1 Tax=Arthrobacter gengyunqii TaxID=2886940 RepID=A0ABS8GGU5_9MICC|nr:CshA/CshB family fibrillar adhesin-related protein [Arthrobacter gengyunqii]MCC3265625.1 CshA/CshB family fibrillar adhesin-related protein [Arthrobacter gengyunqii]
MSRIRNRISAGLAGVLVLLCVTALPLVVPGEADAAPAAGSGRYASSIHWLDWSKATNTAGSGVFRNRPYFKAQPGTTVTETPAQDFQITATFGQITAGPRSGSSGTRAVHVTSQDPQWAELKNNGYDTGTQYSVITPSDDNSTVSFTLDLSATFRGQPVAVDVVVTDGESAGHWDKERNVLTTNRDPWQNIDNSSRTGAGMWTSSAANGGFGTRTMGPWYTEWGGGTRGTAPIGVSRGATQIRADITATGMQNVMVGVMLPMDFGDAPASYGPAVHLTDWTAVGTNPMAFTGQPGAPGVAFNTALGNPYLGCVPGDPDHNPLYGRDNGAAWTGDDSSGAGNTESTGPCGFETSKTRTGDEDWAQLTGVPAPPRISSGTQDYSVTVNAGKAEGNTVSGWIDWNNNGTFDAAERAQTTVVGGKATLIWTGVAPAAGSTAVGSRFRIAADASEITLPTGAAATGEVEDHLLPVTPDATLAKSATPASGTAVLPGSDVAYALALSNNTDVEAAVDFADHLGSVLDDAVLDESSIMSPAGVSAVFDPTTQTLRITGTLAAKSRAQVTYRVQVRETGFGDSLLTNAVVQRDNPPPADCQPGNPLCTTHPVTDVLLSKGSVPGSGSTVSPGDTISYTVTAQSEAGPADGLVITDDLSDVLDDAVFVPGSAGLSVAGGPAVAVADPAANGILTAGPVTVPAGSSAELTYSVTVRDESWAATLRNVATGASSTEGAVRCDVCSTTHSTNAVVLVQKMGESDAAGWVPMDGSAWTIRQDDSGAPGSELAGAPVNPVAGKTGTFRAENLAAGTYWLEETQAPAGFNLLAESVQFSVTADGTVAILSGAGNGIVSVAAEPASGIYQITVRDVPALELPESGGRGTAMFLIAGGLLLAAAALAIFLPRPRRRQNT